MNIDSLQRHVKATELPLEKLATSSQVSQKEKVGEVGRQFEAILLRQILGHAQQGMFGKSSSAGIYQDLVTSQLAEKVSHAGGLGLAKHLEKELGRELATHGSVDAAGEKSAATTSNAKQAVGGHAASFPHLHKH